MRNVMIYSVCGLALLTMSTAALADADHTHKAEKLAVVDPFTATPTNLEHLRTQVMQASLEQELTAKQKAIAANRVAIQTLHRKAGVAIQTSLPNAAAAQEAQGKLHQLQMQVEQLRSQFAAAVSAVHTRRVEFMAPALVGVTGSGSGRTAIIRMGNTLHSFHSNGSYGSYRVGVVRHNSVMLYGPTGSERLRLSPVREIGIISNPAPMPHASGIGYPAEGNPASQASAESAAIRAHLVQQAGGHLILPPRPGAPGPF